MEGQNESRGIEIVDVGLSRIEFVESVRRAAFQRLIKFMDSIAAYYTNDGERQKQEILNRTLAEVQRIEGEGKQNPTNCVAKSTPKSSRVMLPPSPNPANSTRS